jgi:uncharacterized protein (DUF1778 family)
MAGTAADRDSKSERLEVRLTPAARALLAQAAHLRHTTVTEFVLSSAVREAEDVVAMPKALLADEAAWARLAALLEAPPRPDPEVVARVRRALAK